MTVHKKGEKVVLTRPDSTLTGELIYIYDDTAPERLISIQVGRTAFNLPPSEWNIEWPEPPVVLPGEDDYYLSGSARLSRGLLQLAHGEWWWIGNSFQPNPERLTVEQVVLHAPFTRLAPVAETAAKMREELVEIARCIGQSSGLSMTVTSTMDVTRARRIVASLIKSAGATDE